MFLKLLTTAFVNGKSRNPDEGVIHVSDEEGQRLLDNKSAIDVSADFSAKQVKGTPYESVTVTDGPAPEPATIEPHQSQVAPQAVDAASTTTSAAEAAPASKE